MTEQAKTLRRPDRSSNDVEVNWLMWSSTHPLWAPQTPNVPSDCEKKSVGRRKCAVDIFRLITVFDDALFGTNEPSKLMPWRLFALRRKVVPVPGRSGDGDLGPACNALCCALAPEIWVGI